MIGYCWDIGRNPGQVYIDIRCSYSMINMMKVIEGLPKYNDPDKELARNASIILSLEYYMQ